MADPGQGGSVLCVTVNVHGSAVELREAPADKLYGKLGYGRYGANVGNERILAMLARLGIGATFFVPAFEAENDPALVERILKAGHEVAAHGYAMENHAALGEREAEILGRAHEALTRIVGTAPVGWRAPDGRMSPATLGHLAALGYRYDSSFQDDDQPYALAADGGGGMIELPQNQILIDATFYRAHQPHDRVAKHWREELDASLAEGCFLCLTLHPRSDYGSGRASRVAVAEAFLAEAIRRNVPLKRCIDAI